MAEQDELMTVRAAAKECRRTPETVRRWIWDGKLPAQKLGNQLFVRRADVLRLCAGEPVVDKAARLAALEAAVANAEAIRQEIGGNFGVLEALERSRESHP